MPGILDSLNPRQREAVCYEDGGLLVLAGAGTGKTRVLTSRIAWLVGERGMPPHAILAVTFTNKAAKEMRGRIFSMLRARHDAVALGTFHGLCHRMLRRHAAAAGWDSNFQIMDSQDQKNFVRRLLSEHKIDPDDYPPADCCRYINSAKERGLRAAAASDQRGGGWREIYERYENAARRDNKMDFAELLLSAAELLRNDTGLRRHYAARFRHLLIDEFQDTNPLQYEWLKLLDGGDNCFFAVGDDDQSIYSFRGADPGNMKNFRRELRADKIIRLEENYRSTANILGAANALIARNKDRLGKKLFTAAAAGGAIAVSPAHSDVGEAENIAEGMEKNLAEGIAAADIAALYRTNAQSRLLEKSLIQRGIPYRIYGGLRFFERLEIKHALAYLRLAASDDVDSLLRIINIPPRKIGKQTIAALSAKGDIFSAVRESAAANVSAFRAIVFKLRTMRERGAPLSELAQAAVADSGLLRHYESRPDESERAANLREFVSAARQFETEFESDESDEDDGDALSAFLANAALESGESQDGSGSGEPVNLMTAHAAKGLEFAAVHIAGLEEGVFPSAQSLDAGEIAVEEERRLMYVALTRARRQLFLHYANERMLYGVRQSYPRSRFLDELPEEAMHYLSPPTPRFDSRSSAEAMRKHFGNALSSAKIHRSPSAKESRRRPPSPKKVLPRAGNYRPGDSVRHAKYGDGIVVRLLGDGEELKLEAAFKQVGLKTFAVKLARLEKI